MPNSIQTDLRDNWHNSFDFSHFCDLESRSSRLVWKCRVPWYLSSNQISTKFVLLKCMSTLNFHDAIMKTAASSLVSLNLTQTQYWNVLVKYGSMKEFDYNVRALSPILKFLPCKTNKWTSGQPCGRTLSRSIWYSYGSKIIWCNQ